MKKRPFLYFGIIVLVFTTLYLSCPNPADGNTPSIPSTPKVVVTGVSLNKPSTYILLNSKETLYATIAPANATNKNLKWSSSDTSIATVSANGEVTGIKVGSTTITVTTADGGKTASCTVNVSDKAVPVTGITLNKSSTTIDMGSTETLTYTIIPSNATNQNLTWSSSNPAIATVTQGGLVTGVPGDKEGTVTITVTTDDGKKTATCIINVLPPAVIYAKTITAGTDGSQFFGVAVDSSGNVYAAGSQSRNGAYNYGSGNINGTSNGSNSVLVKYNSSGTAQWAKTITKTINNMYGGPVFSSVTVDSSGNVYVAGSQYGNGSLITCYYSDNVYITGKANYYNPVLVKYNSSGIVQWAKTNTAGTLGAAFNGITVDASGNVYAIGWQGANSYNYGSGDIAGSSTSSMNSVIVKYNSSGVCQWAKTITVGTGYSKFNGVAVDTSGNVYAVGEQEGTGAYNYGSGDIAGPSTSSNSVIVNVIVKYNSSGVCQWAKTIAGTDGGWNRFTGVAVDSSGVYAVGFLPATGVYNSMLVKYDSFGSCQWAKIITAGIGNSQFNGVAVDSSGVYAVGHQEGTGAYNYENKNISGTSSSYNSVLVKYRK